uniref:Uncharacterized protein n=1 Tax=Pyxicephalus adspersus TaxID=30357 RepID=A0AAV3ATD0_PYXAD|nr:TPA: hypothetical protein GDO54_011521 [Pyxicephalus adspersus]
MDSIIFSYVLNKCTIIRILSALVKAKSVTRSTVRSSHRSLVVIGCCCSHTIHKCAKTLLNHLFYKLDMSLLINVFTPYYTCIHQVKLNLLPMCTFQLDESGVKIMNVENVEEQLLGRTLVENF